MNLIFTLIAALGAVFTSTSHAAHVSPRAICNLRLSVNAKYRRLKKLRLDRPTFEVAAVHLLNQALVPAMQVLIDRAHVPGEVMAHPVSPATTEELPPAEALPEYDGHYERTIVQPIAYYYTNAPFTAHNERIMRRLSRASAVFYLIYQAHYKDMVAATREGINVVVAHSSSGSDIGEIFDFGFMSVLQALSRLTADPVEGFTAEQMLRAIMTGHGKTDGLMVRFALALAPAQLGPWGETHYLKNPLTVDDQGSLIFSAKLKHFIQEGRREFLNRWPQVGEYGHGCPIAHRVDRHQSSALQQFLDTLMWIDGVLESSSVVE